MKIKENYAAIERTVALVKEKFGADSKIAVMFEKCISNTLQTTIKIKENDTVFVITGIFLLCGCVIRHVSSARFIVCKGRTGTCGTGMRADQKTNAVHSFRSICQCI